MVEVNERFRAVVKARGSWENGDDLGALAGRRYAHQTFPRKARWPLPWPLRVR